MTGTEQVEQAAPVVEDAEGATGADNGALNPESFVGPDLAAAWEQQIDDEALKQAESELLLPVGWFTTVPGSFKGRLEQSEFDPERPVASFFGPIVKYDDQTKANAVDPATGKEIKGTQGYRISPMRRNKITTAENGVKTDTGKPDFKHNLWIQAANAYHKAYGERATKRSEILGYLNDYPHQVRVTKTQDNRNMIVAIRAVPEQE